MTENRQKRSTETRISRGEIIILVSVLLLAGFMRIPSLTQPLGPDQGIMSVIGAGILDGKLPYRDFWEMASPAIFFTYAFMFKLFGQTMAAIPITDMVVSIVTTFLIYLLARAVWEHNYGIASALFFAVFSSGVRLGMHSAGDIAFGTFWYISQRETFMLPLIVGSIHLTLSAVKFEQEVYYFLFKSFFVARLDQKSRNVILDNFFKTGSGTCNHRTAQCHRLHAYKPESFP